VLKNNGFHNRHSPASRQFSPLSLFSSGAPGAWYDPSDYTTLFQDAAGTTPVTAVEQTVGRMLDKSGNGNHATQSFPASRPTLSARYNLLTSTETLATQSVTTQAVTQTLRFTGAGSITLTGTAIGVYTAGTHSITTTAGSLTLTVLGTVTQADLRASSNVAGMPTYQRVNTSTDYDTAGFFPYLRYDGVDDSMSLTSPTTIPQPFVMAIALGNYLSGTGNADANLFRSASNAVSYRASGGAAWTIFAGTVLNAPAAYVAGRASRIDTFNGASSSIRSNGTVYAGSAGALGLVSTAGAALRLNVNDASSNHARINEYGRVLIGRTLTSTELTSLDTYFGSKLGITI
jgi:hypothetical protein